MINLYESRWTEMKEGKQRQKLANWPALRWHFGHWASNSGLKMDHLSSSSFRRLTCGPHKKRQFGGSLGPRVWVFHFVIWHRCPDINKAPRLSISKNIWTLSSDTDTDIADSAQTEYCSTFHFPSVTHRRDISNFLNYLMMKTIYFPKVLIVTICVHQSNVNFKDRAPMWHFPKLNSMLRRLKSANLAFESMT